MASFILLIARWWDVQARLQIFTGMEGETHGRLFRLAYLPYVNFVAAEHARTD